MAELGELLAESILDVLVTTIEHGILISLGASSVEADVVLNLANHIFK